MSRRLKAPMVKAPTYGCQVYQPTKKEQVFYLLLSEWAGKLDSQSQDVNFSK